MNTLSWLKRKAKKAAFIGVPVTAAVVGSVSSSSAAMDFSTITTAIAAAGADVVTGGLILVGGYVAFWGVKRVKDLFARG